MMSIKCMTITFAVIPFQEILWLRGCIMQVEELTQCVGLWLVVYKIVQTPWKEIWNDWIPPRKSPQGVVKSGMTNQSILNKHHGTPHGD